MMPSFADTTTDTKTLSKEHAIASGRVARELRKSIVITKDQNSFFEDAAELFEYRELIWSLVWRDLTTRYRQTVLGASWAVIQPLGMMLVMSLFFGKYLHAPADKIPYPVFCYTGLLAWQCFSSSVSRSSNSVLAVGGLLKRVYFPRLTVPIASVLPPLVDFGVAFALLLVMFCVFQIAPTWRVLLLPAFVMLMVGISLGIGLWTSALHVRYRDFYHLIPFVLQLWMLASPVAYAASIVPPQWRLLYSVNPMVGILEGFRWCLLGTACDITRDTFVSAAICCLLFVSGTIIFRKLEGSFADYV